MEKLKKERPSFAKLETFVAVILGWWAVPGMTGSLTGLHLVLFGVTVFLGLSF